MKKKISIGAVLLLEVLIVFVIFLFEIWITGGGQGIHNYIDMPSLLIILLITIPSLCISGLGKDFLRAFSIGKKPYPLRQLKRSMEAVEMVQKLILCASGFSAVVATVMILSRLDDPAVIGPNLAVVILSVFYMIILEVLLLPLKAHVQNAVTDLMDVEDEEV